MKARNQKGVVIKIELSKAYDRVSWLYIRMMLTHLGFNYAFVRWIVNCISTISFAVLINGLTYEFLSPKRGLR